MGLFSKLLKPKAQGDTQVNWLNKVDAAYNRAFQVKNVAGLEQYLTRKCLAVLMERVRLGDKAYAGIERYKHTQWENNGRVPEGIMYTKHVTYDNVRMSHGVSIPIGDQKDEQWLLVMESGCNKVSDIKRIKHG